MTRARAALLGAALALGGALAWRVALHLGPVDDAYISLRAAANWAHGLGPVFNAGVRVEGTTSPLWTALLALGIHAGAPPLSWMLVLGLASTALAGALAAALAFEAGGALAAVAAALTLALLPGWSGWAVSGLETPLAGALLLLAAWLAAGAEGTARGLVAGVFAALAALARPEALLVLPALVLVARDRRGAAALATTAAALVGAAFVARHSYYGDWLPNTYYAKAGDGGVALRLRGVSYVGVFALFHLPLLAAALLGARDRARVQWLAVAVVFAAAVAWEGGDHFPLARLALPVVPLLASMAGSGVAALRGYRRVLVALLLVAGVPLAASGDDGAKRLSREAGYARQWRAIGEALREPRAPPGSVATVTIGAIGYVSGRPILDLAGLVDHHLARAPRLPGGASGHDRVDVDYVLGREPALVIAVPALTRVPMSAERERAQLAAWRAFGGGAERLLLDPRFQERYEPRDLPAPGGFHLRAWVRR